IDAVKHQYARKWIGWEDGKSDLLGDVMQLETAWYIRTDSPREKVGREFGQVIFAGESGGITAFKTAVMKGTRLTDTLERGINALSMFRVLGGY
ncbi:MAG: hypothetical protein FWB75_06780, partial [Oscillospiraceae bacterium]|nr:hypothetical protein [Oscillospiraceae bacterium]